MLTETYSLSAFAKSLWGRRARRTTVWDPVLRDPPAWGAGDFRHLFEHRLERCRGGQYLRRLTWTKWGAGYGAGI